jgi:hypothetical protein
VERLVEMGQEMVRLGDCGGLVVRRAERVRGQYLLLHPHAVVREQVRRFLKCRLRKALF